MEPGLNVLPHFGSFFELFLEKYNLRLSLKTEKTNIGS